MTDEYWTPAFELILEESRRSIDRQSERVQSVRERALGLVGFGSLIAAALSFGADAGPLGPWGAVALVAFVAVTITALYVLYPREFKFELGPQRMSEWFDDPANRGINHMVHTTAVRHGEHHHFNHQKLKRMQFALALGVVGLSIETVALVARLVL